MLKVSTLIKTQSIQQNNKSIYDSTQKTCIILMDLFRKTIGNRIGNKTIKNYTEIDYLEKNAEYETIFLLDISGSMNARIGGSRKRDILRKVIDKINKFDKIKYISFDGEIHDTEDVVIYESPNHDMTSMKKVFDYVNNNYVVKNIVMITDGCPNDDSEENTISSVCRLKIPINVIYIGEERYSAFVVRLSMVLLRWREIKKPVN